MSSSAAIRPLDLAFVPSFKGADSLVLHGDQAALAVLASALESLASSRSSCIELHKERGFKSHNIELTVLVSDAASGLEVRGTKLMWRNTRSVWASCATTVRELSNVSLGHAYLELPGQLQQVLVSCNEYRTLFERNDA